MVFIYKFIILKLHVKKSNKICLFTINILHLNAKYDFICIIILIFFKKKLF